MKKIPAPRVFASTAFTLIAGMCTGQVAHAQSDGVEAALQKANDCIAARNFSCADINIRLAAQHSNTDADRAALAEAKARLSGERRIVAAAEQSIKANDTGRDDAQLAAEFEASERRRSQRDSQATMAERRRKQAQDDEWARSTSKNSGLEILQKTQRDMAEMNALHNKHVQEVNRIATERRRAESDRAQREREFTAATRTANASHASSSGTNASWKAEPKAVAKTEAGSTVPPTERVGTPNAPDSDGCYIPNRTPPLCVSAVGSWTKGSSGEYKVRYTNSCPTRVYLSSAVEFNDGRWSKRADGLHAGETKTWSTPESSGRHTYSFTGSVRGAKDWVCAGKDRVFFAEPKL